MLVIILPDAKAVGQRAAGLAARLIGNKPQAVIGLAAGATPLEMYACLARRQQAGQLDCSKITVFALDEYLGLSSGHPASCGYALKRHFIEPLGLRDSQVNLVEGDPAADLAAYCAQYEQRIERAGGIDLQILGLGVNGHIGFNEPGRSLRGRMHPLGLRRSTREINRPGFLAVGDDVPKAAVTMGVGTILEAKRLMLLATGAKKAEAVAKLVEGPLTAMVPASALQMHPDALVLLDEAAASGLKMRDDYDSEIEALMNLQGAGGLLV